MWKIPKVLLTSSFTKRENNLTFVSLDLTFGERAITRTIECLLKPKAQILMPNRKLQGPTSKYSNHFLTGTEYTVCYYFSTYYDDFFSS